MMRLLGPGALVAGLTLLVLVSSGVASTFNRVTFVRSSLIGDASDDTGSAVAVAPNNDVVVGLNTQRNLWPTPVALRTTAAPTLGGRAQIAVLSAAGIPKAAARLGGQVDDLDINPTNGTIAAIGQFGVVLLPANVASVTWEKNFAATGSATASNGRRVAVGRDGVVVAMAGNRVRVYSATGQQLGDFSPGSGRPEDVAYDSVSKTVIVGGWSQKDGGPCTDLQVPWMRGFSTAGVQKWVNWDYTHAQVAATQSSCADSRITRVAIGNDGKLYTAGTMDGGNTIFRINPRNLAQTFNIVGYDNFTRTHNMSGARKLTFISRYVAATGVPEVGQFHVARLSDGKGNSITPSAITAASDGTVYVSGSSAASFADRSLQKIGPLPIGPYSGSDGYILVIPSDFRSRRAMTSVANGCSFGLSAIAVGIQAAAAVGTANANCVIHTVQPFQTASGGLKDAVLNLWHPATAYGN